MDIVFGILHLSSQRIWTTKSLGMVKKEFTCFGRKLGADLILVKTKKTKLAPDVYAIVKIEIMDETGATGHVLEYMGDVMGNTKNLDIMRMMGICHWTRGLDKTVGRLVGKDNVLERMHIDQEIYTIDPVGCRDFDDALHLVEIENGYEIGIHIADVSSWIEHGSEYDVELSKRVETVYFDHDGLQPSHMIPLEVFEDLKKKESLNYLFTINSDCVSPLYPTDKTRYIYTGSIGKVLPCFYVIGKEAHVGQCFEGFDASMVASELVRMINLNPEFCDGKDGEYTAPPSVLKLKDLKPSYNVQTSFSSFVYFNFMVTHRSTTEILNMLKDTAGKAMNNVIDIINERYKSYCELSSIQYTKRKYDTKVLEYKEVYGLAKDVYDGNLDENIEELTLSLIKQGVDKREVSLEITKHLCEIAGIRTPTVVVFFATPYCPHNTINEEVTSEKLVLEALKEVLEKYENETDEKFKILKFFACLTDSSYVKIDDDDKSIESLVSNFPKMEKLYNVPIDTIKKLNIPSINIGCFGKDPHKWTERVHMPYSFGVLPKVVIEMIEKNLMK